MGPPDKVLQVDNEIKEPEGVMIVAMLAPTVPKILEEAGLKGVKAAIIISSGLPRLATWSLKTG